VFRILGKSPTDSEVDAYLEAYFGDRLSDDLRAKVISDLRNQNGLRQAAPFDSLLSFFRQLAGIEDPGSVETHSASNVVEEASTIASLLVRSTEEMDSILQGLDGGYIKPAPGGGKSLMLFSSFWLQILIRALNRLASGRTWRFADWEEHSCA
jgi:magnesium chelatase subunit H